MTLAPAPGRASQMLPWSLVVYAAASLLHFAHNAEYLAAYPNLPTSWTPADVYLAWAGIASLGLLGYLLYRAAYRRVGLTVLTIYGVLGLGGLLHYTRASMAHHSAAMNLTIWTEVAAAVVFLVTIARIATGQLHR